MSNDVVSLAHERLTRFRPFDGERPPTSDPRVMVTVGPGVWVSDDDNVAIVETQAGEGILYLAFWRDESTMGYQGTDAWRVFPEGFGKFGTALGAINAHWDMLYS